MSKRYAIRATLPRGQYVVIDTEDCLPTMLSGSKWSAGKHLRLLGSHGRFLSRNEMGERGHCLSYRVVGGAEGSTNVNDAEMMCAYLNGASFRDVVRGRVNVFCALIDSPDTSDDMRAALDRVAI